MLLRIENRNAIPVDLNFLSIISHECCGEYNVSINLCDVYKTVYLHVRVIVAGGRTEFMKYRASERERENRSSGNKKASESDYVNWFTH